MAPVARDWTVSMVPMSSLRLRDRPVIGPRVQARARTVEKTAESYVFVPSRFGVHARMPDG